jgi:hypothetical protein
MQVSTLRFTEITALPDPESYYYYERACSASNGNGKMDIENKLQPQAFARVGA